MDIPLRIKALEDRVNDLEKGTAQQAPAQQPIRGNINFTGGPPGPNQALFLTLNRDGTCTIDGKNTVDPTEIGQAVLKFQRARVKGTNGQLLTMVPKGEA